MKRKLLILTVTLLCLACLFAVGVSATEDTTPTLDLTYTNLSFNDSVYLKYAVSAEKVTPDDVRLLVWTEPQSDYTDTTNATTLMPLYLENIEGEDYIIFDYTDLAAKQMTDVVYARATVKVNGTTYYSAVRKYSILRYAYTVMNDPTSEATLVTMLTDMLDYGASAQKHFKYKADRPANGAWHDIRVVNGTHADGFTYGLYMDGDQVTLTADPAPEGKVLYWVNSDGRIIADKETLTITVSGKDETYTVVYRDEIKYSEGLEFTLNGDQQSYSVTGIGTCEDTDIIIPAIYEGLPVTSIGRYAFERCTSLVSVTFGENSQLTSIDGYAFNGCTSLTSITIPDSVTGIGGSAFHGCTSLVSIIVDSNNENYASIDGNLYSKDGTTLIQYAVGKTDTSFTIPDSVTSIGDQAFYGCTSLASVTFGENSQLTSIGGQAFFRCTSLTSITIPDSVTSIDYHAFCDCWNLASVTLGENSELQSIEMGTFMDCFNLQHIFIPGSVHRIGVDAFANCFGLTSVTFATEGLSLYIEARAFQGCSEAHIELPDRLSRIAPYAFIECYIWDGTSETADEGGVILPFLKMAGAQIAPPSDPTMPETNPDHTSAIRAFEAAELYAEMYTELYGHFFPDDPRVLADLYMRYSNWYWEL